MKVEGWLFIGLGGFLIGADVVYWYLSYDPTGTVLIALGVGLALLAGFYVLFTGRRLPLRPDDNPSAEVHDGTGSLGFYSPHSWWPFWVGLAGAVTATGFAVGWWLFLIGVVSMFFASVGFVFEYYRGAFKH